MRPTAKQHPQLLKLQVQLLVCYYNFVYTLNGRASQSNSRRFVLRYHGNNEDW